WFLSRTGPPDDDDVARLADRRPRMIVAVGQCLGQAFAVVGVLDLIAQPLERLASLRRDGVLDAHKRVHRRSEILLRPAEVEAAVVLVRSAIPRDRAGGGGKRVQASEQRR